MWLPDANSAHATLGGQKRVETSLHESLVALDEPGRLEFPADPASSFSWQTIDTIFVELCNFAGRELDVDRSVQDASFLTDIGLLDERAWDRRTRSGAVSYEFAFRFSNFGFLFSVHGVRLPEWRRVCDGGVQLISARGGRYIPADDLQAPYDGPNASVLSGQTWWIRYFDYV